MSKMTRRGLLAGAAAGASLTLAGRGARAQSGWPNRPVRFIVPLAPGGAIDFIARALGERMSGPLGHNVLVENRTGAGGTIGMDAAMKSPPDGYTVLITNDNHQRSSSISFLIPGKFGKFTSHRRLSGPC